MQKTCPTLKFNNGLEIPQVGLGMMEQEKKTDNHDEFCLAALD